MTCVFAVSILSTSCSNVEANAGPISDAKGHDESSMIQAASDVYSYEGLNFYDNQRSAELRKCSPFSRHSKSQNS